MKPLRIISILLLVLFCLSSCHYGTGAGTPTEPNVLPESSEPAESSSADTTEEEPTAEATTEEEPFDFEYWLKQPTLEPDRQDLPSYETFCKIEPGMRIDKVYELIGNPQRDHIGMGISIPGAHATLTSGYLYDSSDSEPLWLAFHYHYAKRTIFVSDIIRDGKLYSYYDYDLDTIYSTITDEEVSTTTTQNDDSTAATTEEPLEPSETPEPIPEPKTIPVSER